LFLTFKLVLILKETGLCIQSLTDRTTLFLTIYFIFINDIDISSKTGRRVLDTTLSEKVLSVNCGRSVFFFNGTPVSSNNKTAWPHDISEIWLKVS